PWPVDFGPELSRGFRALKVWAHLLEHGTQKIGASIARNCDLAKYLADQIEMRTEFELLAPVSLNICCFRYRAPGLSDAQLDDLNGQLVAWLQNEGIAAPSTTRLDGRLAIRVNITNHRTQQVDLDILLDALERGGAERLGD
ncbi:MAG: pyridoxal-dependent decarboxylase, partial [Pseudomonadota bacterium]